MLHPQKREVLEQAPQRPGIGRVALRLWGAPNEVIGWTLGGAGHVAGGVAHRLGLTKRKPRIVRSPGKTEFVNNPFVPLGAVTFGHTTSFGDDPYDPADYARHWKYLEAEEGHTVFDHEAAHMPQSDQLGPLYLFSNLAGGLTALVRDGDWHGPHNWNERGPRMDPARPWVRRSRP